MIDHWERLSTKECCAVQELAANNWDNITVEVVPFKVKKLNDSFFNRTVVDPDKIRNWGQIIIRYEIKGIKYTTTIKAQRCGYNYRNQKIKPWENNEKEIHAG